MSKFPYDAFKEACTSRFESDKLSFVSVTDIKQKRYRSRPLSLECAVHRYDIRAALQKKGLTLTQVSRDAGLSPRACSFALLYPSRAAEVAIAAALGIAPMKLWPDRFSTDGSRRIRQPRRKPADNTVSARRTAGGQ